MNRFDLIESARRYAEADRSDPFAFRRAMTQIKNGIAHNSETCFDAEETTEVRHLPDGITLSNGDTSYTIKGWRNVRRP